MSFLSISKNLRDLSKEELSGLVQLYGEPSYRAVQLYRWLFARSIDEIDSMTDLPQQLRTRLKEDGFHLKLPEPVATERSADGSMKIALKLEDGNIVESVLIPEERRLTLCVSTQTGCNLGCRFCKTASFQRCRNLTLSELFSQVELARRLIEKEPSLGEYQRITNIVLMGMGEPLNNLEEVLKFIGVLTDPDGLGFSSRRITLSTTGILPALKRLLKATRINIAISLNATDEDTRTFLMPVNRKYPLKKLLRVLRYSPLFKRRSVTVEYVLIKGVNDSAEDARRLAELLRRVRCKVNLIALNPFDGCQFNPPDEPAIERFRRLLEERGLTVLVRKSRGRDILAACGQLGSKADKTS